MGIKEPEKGICMPHDFDSEKILEIDRPYLGKIIDINLPFRLPAFWKELLSSKEEMDSVL